MPRHERKKQARIDRVMRYLRQHRNGATEQEIADALSLNRRTVNNYLNELLDEYRVDKDGTLWYVTRTQYPQLRPIDLEPEEAIVMYLATRLLAKQQDKRNEAAESALFKLAEVLTADIGVGYEIRQAAEELANRQENDLYTQIFTPLVQGYLYQRAVEIEYSPRFTRAFRTTFHPYLLEPSAIGYTTYIIGYSSTPDALRTYKLERIRSAVLTDETYTIPDDFVGLEVLRDSWSIMLGDDLVEVVLRFHPSVVDRVKETRWHPSEHTSPDPEKAGWLRWSVTVADTTDMLPWIRGWGSDVEVLEPDDLRQDLVRESTRLSRLYGTDTSENQAYTDLFGGQA